MKRVARSVFNAASRRDHAKSSSLKVPQRITVESPESLGAHFCTVGQQELNRSSKAREFRSKCVVGACARHYANTPATQDVGYWDGGESMADEMIRYSQSRRRKDFEESTRILEHGLSFLVADGKGCATSAARVLLCLSTLYMDSANLEAASEALQKAAMLEGASAEVQVAALEALSGICLRRNQDDAAIEFSAKSVQVADAALRESGEDNGTALALKSRAQASLALAQHLRGNVEAANLGSLGLDTAERLFVEANSEQENFSDDVVFGSEPLVSQCFTPLPVYLQSNTAAAVLADAHHCHSWGRLAHAAALYERALHLAGRGESGAPKLAVAAAAMAPTEVVMAALAGLGQLAGHLGDYEEAEAKLTAALTKGESISGPKHPRVGAILSAMAHVYHCRAVARGNGDRILSEGLYKKALELMGGHHKKEGGGVDLTDLIALTEARCAVVLSWAEGRSSEADQLMRSAGLHWQSNQSMEVALARGGVPEGPLESGRSEKNVEGTHDAQAEISNKCTVVDVRLGRVFV